MKISIIMPVYNNQEYLQIATRSIINQTYKNWELIIINDGSTDETSIICDKLVSEDKRITVFHEKNRGPSSARNLGIERSTGEYCLFVDSDDYLELDALEILVKKIEKEKVDLVLYGYNDIEIYTGKSIVNNTKVTPYNKYTENKQFRNDYNFYDSVNYTHPIWNKAYKKEFIEKHHIRYPTDVYNSGDFIFNLHVFKNVKNVISIEQVLYNYVNHNSGSITTSFRLEKIDSYEKIYLKAYKILNEWNPLAKNNLHNEYVVNISSFINSLYREECYLDEEQKIELVKNIINRESVRNCLKEIKPVGLRNKVISYLIQNKTANLLLITGKIAKIKRKI